MSRRHLRTLLLVVAAQVACSNSDRALELRIAVEARKGANTLVRIASLTDFAWERLHVFGPYASHEAINQELGFLWPEAARTGISGRDGIALLVFVRDGAVVRYVAQPRSEGDFADVKIPGGLSPAEAVFVVRIEDHGRVFHLAEPGHRPDMERPVKSARSPNNFKSSTEGGRGGIATVDHSDIRGSEPHTGATSD